MKSVIKFRLYPNKSQRRELFRQFDKHCELYNYCRNERIETYKLTKTSPSCIDQIKSNVSKFKDKTNVSSLQQTVRRVDKSFQNFFRRIKHKQTLGFPRYKKRLNSIDFTARDGIKIINNEYKRKLKLYVQHVGNIKMIAHRSLSTNAYSRVTIKYQNGQFFASFIINSPIKTLPLNEKSIGLDFGLKTFITTSDGNKIDNPKFLKRNLKRLKQTASKRDKYEKGSHIRNKKNRIVRNIYRKITNQRSDFNHKLANNFIENYGTIIVENLDLRKLSDTEISNVNRTYNDVSWEQFSRMLQYKAANAGRQFVRVNPRNTSKTCHGCGKIHDLTLNDRTFTCQSCGYEQDRDINAARNILTLGLQSLRLT